MKTSYWKVKVLHPTENSILEEKNFESVEDISKYHKRIPLITWKNICAGRSKIYEKFIVCEKVKRDTTPERKKNNEIKKLVNKLPNNKKDDYIKQMKTDINNLIFLDDRDMTNNSFDAKDISIDTEDTIDTDDTNLIV